MTLEELIEALKNLGRGRLDAAYAIAEHLMAQKPETVAVPLPDAEAEQKAD